MGHSRTRSTLAARRALQQLARPRGVAANAWGYAPDSREYTAYTKGLAACSRVFAAYARECVPYS